VVGNRKFVIVLIARIRMLIHSKRDERFKEIVAGFRDGSLRAPATPMTDQELGAAIAEFVEAKP